MEGIDEYLASARRRLEPGRRVIFCNDGYKSSLAASILIDLGVDGGHGPDRWLQGVEVLNLR